MQLSKLFNILAVILVMIVSLAIIGIVYFNMKSQALRHSESIANAILDRSDATQTYFREHLRPSVFSILDRTHDQENYFDPTWMSTSYFIKESEAIYSSISREQYSYRECAVDARNPENEAAGFEQEFLQAINADPELKQRTVTLDLDGEPYLVVLRRGKTITAACLQCHGEPEDAPPGMLARYGSERAFHRQVGEVVSAYTIRIPLAASVAEARHFTVKLSAVLLATLGGIFFFQYSVNKRLIFRPLDRLRQKACQIASDPASLGEQIPEPFGRELAEMTTAFNSMSQTIAGQQENLQHLVDVRTRQLSNAVKQLNLDIEERNRAQNALARLKNQNEMILNAVWEGIFGVDSEGRATFLNPAAEKLLGWPAAELVGRNIHDLIHHSCTDGIPHPWERCATFASLRDGKVHHVTGATFWRRNGEAFTVESSTVPIWENETVAGAVVTFRDITERQKNELKIRQLAFFDPLTGLPNRQLLRERLGQMLLQEKRQGGSFAVMFIDLDGFKDINDSLGHSAGDQFLQAIAERLKKTLRESDTLARIGGDEFVFVGRLRDTADAGVIARKFLSELAQPVELQGQDLFSSGSIGIALFPGDGQEVDTLLMNADAAMYQAKAVGKNTFRFFFQQITEHNLQRLALLRDLRLALERDELCLHFQPQIDTQNGRLVGLEVLVRWQHPELGLVMPKSFISLAEENGLILPLGDWVLRRACAQSIAWQAAGMAPVKLAVNISGYQFKQPDFVARLEEILEETGFDPGYLELELTESIIMKNAEETTQTLKRLRAMGIGLAIDDFGTGYSSLSYLKHFPIDLIKIDQSFVADMLGNAEDAAIVGAMVGLAGNLGIGVVAEGVETKEQMRLLRDLGCCVMQGYHFSPALPSQEIFTELQVGDGLFTPCGCA